MFQQSPYDRRYQKSGEGGIRTHGHHKATRALQARLIGHSSTSPHGETIPTDTMNQGVISGEGGIRTHARHKRDRFSRAAP